MLQDQAYKTIQMTEKATGKCEMQHHKRRRRDATPSLKLSSRSTAWLLSGVWGSAADEPTCCSGWSCSWFFSLTGVDTWQGFHEKQTLGAKLVESYSLSLVELFFLLVSLSRPPHCQLGQVLVLAQGE